MAQDGPEWARLRIELHGARKARKLTLDQVRGNLMTRGNLSKMEKGTHPLTRPIVERYALLTGIRQFVTAFDYLANKDAHPDLDPSQLPPIGTVLVAAEVEQTVDVGDLVRVIERRSVLPKIQRVEATSIGLHFKSSDGRRPQVLPVQAHRAEIVLQGWADRSNYLVALRFPEDAVVVGQEPYEFSLIYEHELPTPMIGLVPSEPLPLYRLTIKLPPFATDVFELHGVLPEVLDEFTEAAARGESTGVRSRPFDASAELTRDFLDLKPARFYGVAWFPRGRPKSASADTRQPPEVGSGNFPRQLS